MRHASSREQLNVNSKALDTNMYFKFKCISLHDWKLCAEFTVNSFKIKKSTYNHAVIVRQHIMDHILYITALNQWQYYEDKV